MKKTLIAMGILLAAVSLPTFAATIGPSCGTCQGGTYTLTYETVSLNQGGLDTYNVFLNINTALYTGGGTLINAVAPKIVSGNIVTETLLTAPTPIGGWTTTPGGLNANGCDGAGSGFICSQANSPANAALVSSITNSWSWQVQITAGTALLTGPDAASIKVEFTDNSGTKVGALVSEGITLTPNSSVPEPSTWAMLGLGLCGAGLIGRRRRA